MSAHEYNTPPVFTITGCCPLCSNPLAVRSGRHGVFIGCVGYPRCTFTTAYDPVVTQLQRAGTFPTGHGPTSHEYTRQFLKTLERKILVAITQMHPDRWADHQIATEATKHLTALLQEVRHG